MNPNIFHHKNLNLKITWLKAFAIFAICLVLFSCSKDKKPEFVDDETGSKSTDTKTEQKQDNPVKQDTSGKINNNSSNNTSSKQQSFETEKPSAVISPLEAGDYNGKTVTVKGFVADVYQSDKVAYLNFVEKYPNNPFTAVIFASKFEDFPDIFKYKNKDIEVTGRVSMFKGKPQIICNNPKQIVVK